MKKSKLLFTSGALGTLYLIYLIWYFIGGTAGAEGEDAIGGVIATALVAPHMIFVGLASLFSWIAWAIKARWAALVGGILYSVSMLVMILYTPFVILQLIFCFVAFAKMKNVPKQQTSLNT